MTPADWHRLRDLLDQALQRPASERPAFLDAACADAPALRAEVETLLAAHERAEATDAFASPFARTNGLPAPEESPLPEDERIGPYRLVRLLGRGGMGAVYLAERADGQFRQTVALKLIRRGLDTDDLLSRFAFERQILAGLDHPHIARLYDGGVTEDGRPYFAMEYVEGEPITAYCDAHRLSTRHRLALFRTVCRAVQHAHRNLVVHRDLKPSNILVTADGQVKLLDFGIAKLLSDEGLGEGPALPQTRTGVHLLTPEYAAPEQVKGAAITTATDVYQLGVLLYELLTGHRPYRLPSRVQYEIARIILEEEPERPSTAVGRTEKLAGEAPDTRTPASVSRARATDPGRLQRRLAGDLDVICLTALKKEPARRYASVEALAEDVRRHLEGLPVTARPDTFGYRASRFIRRNRVAVAAATVVALTVLVGAGVAIWQARVAAAERDRAQAQAAKAEAVNEFMTEVLTAADGSWIAASAVAGPNVTVAAVLDAAAARLDREPLDDPLVEAAVRRSIGTAYRSLTKLDAAQAQLERSVALLQANVRPPHPDLAMSLHDLGIAHYFRSEFATADTLLREALAQWRATRETPDKWLFAYTNDAGLGLSIQGRSDDAEPYFEEAVRLSRLVPDVTVSGAGAAITNLVQIRLQQRRYEEADSLIREGLALYAGNDSTTSFERYVQMYTAASVARRLGRYARADSLGRAAISGLRATVGEESPYYALALFNHTWTLLERERYDEAEAGAAEVGRRVAALWPPGSPLEVRARHLRGVVHTKRGRLEEGEADLRYALAYYEKNYEHVMEAHVVIPLDLAENLQKQGRNEEAEAFLRQALETAEDSATRPDDPLVAQVRARLEAAGKGV